MWHLSRGAVYATDHANAAQTLLFNILTKSWDKELLELFGIPPSILPSILPTSSYYGDAFIEGLTIPIHASITEHQASLMGNGCFQEGDVYLHYEKDGYILINTAKKIFIMPELLTTIGWSNNGHTAYLLEGTLKAVGSLFEWMRENLGILSPKDDIDDICRRSDERLYMLPAISGLGSPHWNTVTKGSIFGLKSSTKREDIIRAAVESIAYLVKDNLSVIERDGRIQIKRVIAGGHVSDIPYLLQFQSDLLQQPLYKAREKDPTIVGVAFLAGLSLKVWQGLYSLEGLINNRKAFHPKLEDSDVRKLYERWKLTCHYSKEWSKNLS